MDSPEIPIVHKIKDRENSCPFGWKCEQCALYRPMYKTDDKGNFVAAEYDCQINNLALLMSETKNRMVGVQKATEQSRNESASERHTILSLLYGVLKGEAPVQLPEFSDEPQEASGRSAGRIPYANSEPGGVSQGRGGGNQR